VCPGPRRHAQTLLRNRLVRVNSTPLSGPPLGCWGQVPTCPALITGAPGDGTAADRVWAAWCDLC
jgi:hypothetical protein